MAEPSHQIKVTEITLSDGQTVQIAVDAIVVVTGSNNSGKSTFLEEISQFFRKYGRHTYQGRIISNVAKVPIGDTSTIFKFLSELFSVDRKDPNVIKFGYGTNLKKESIEKQWAAGTPQEAIEEQFIINLGLASRVGYIDRRSDPLANTASDLFYNEPKELQISKIFKRAFGKDVILQREGSGGVFKIGSRTKLPAHKDRLTPAFRKIINSMEDVFAQGAGMRSFARIAIQLLTTWKSVVVIDEPELFLHPPQAKQMARLIASDVPADRQIFLATHNETFLRNLLDFGANRVVVLRLDRKISKTHVTVLDNDSISEFWADPLLRTSNIISSLFHDAVVLCEGESDVRFFEAMMDAVYGQENLPDTAFFSCNGKGKIKNVLQAIKNVSIPVVIFLDFDILQNSADVVTLYEICGGQGADIRDDLALLSREIEADHYAPKLKTVRSKLTEAIDGLDENKPVSLAKLSELRTIVDHGSPWAQLKLAGISAVKSQKGYNAADRIIKRCRQQGIIINDLGELESLCRSVAASRKSDWLQEVMQRDLANDPDLQDARDMAVAIKSKLPKVRK